MNDDGHARRVNVGELFHSLDRDAVVAAIERIYPDAIENRSDYLQAWNEIVGLQPQATDIVCRLRECKADSSNHEDADEIHVSGIRRGDPASYAIELVAWERWLSMDIVLDGIDDMKPEDILAHVLREMTWAGYDRKTVAEKLGNVADQVDQIKEVHPGHPSIPTGRLN